MTVHHHQPCMQLWIKFVLIGLFWVKLVDFNYLFICSHIAICLYVNVIFWDIPHPIIVTLLLHEIEFQMPWMHRMSNYLFTYISCHSLSLLTGWDHKWKPWLSKRNSCKFYSKICVWTSPLSWEFHHATNNQSYNSNSPCYICPPSIFIIMINIAKQT